MKYFLLVFTSLLSPLIAAQNTPAPQTHSFEFSVYPIGKYDWDALHYESSPGSFEPIIFWPFERSPKHEYEGVLPLNIYTSQVNEAGESEWKVVAQAQLNPRANPQLLFFIPVIGEDSMAGLQIVGLEDDLDSFPLDTITFFNATGANLEGVFGNKPIFLKTGLSSPYRLSDYYEQETLIGLAVHYEGEFKRVLQSKWIFREDYREIILLLPPKRAGSLKIRAVRIPQHKEEIHPAKVAPPEL
jgi:hypothetical protein